MPFNMTQEEREAFLADLEPVGEMETIVAERFVNLSWRLKRAERMQNQSIDLLGMEEFVGFRAREFAELCRKTKGLCHDDPEVADDHLMLARLATRDWSNCKVLDKMMLYERRIESSMYKAMHELNKLQAARKTEQARAAERQSAQEKPPARRHKGDLKKQSQFAPAIMGTKSYARKGYDDKPRSGVSENKAKQTQCQSATTPRRGGSIRCSSKVQGRLAPG